MSKDQVLYKNQEVQAKIKSLLAKEAELYKELRAIQWNLNELSVDCVQISMLDGIWLTLSNKAVKAQSDNVSFMIVPGARSSNGYTVENDLRTIKRLVEADQPIIMVGTFEGRRFGGNIRIEQSDMIPNLYQIIREYELSTAGLWLSKEVLLKALDYLIGVEDS